MPNPLIRFYGTRPDSARIENPERARRLYERKRWSVFLSLSIGYAFYYVCRLSLSVLKKPIMDAGVLDAALLGIIGSGLTITYAFGKCFNGFLADRANVGRIVFTGLLVSSAINFLSGFLIQASKVVVNGKAGYNFNSAFMFWIGASVLSLLLTIYFWKTHQGHCIPETPEQPTPRKPS